MSVSQTMVSQTRRKKKRVITIIDRNINENSSSNINIDSNHKNRTSKPSVKQPLFTVKNFGSFNHEIWYEIRDKAISHSYWLSRTAIEAKFGLNANQILNEFNFNHTNETPVECIGIVSLIINSRLDMDGEIEYLVQYQNGRAIYEPAVNLEGCAWHIQQYYKRKLMAKTKSKIKTTENETERKIREEKEKMQQRIKKYKRKLPTNESTKVLNQMAVKRQRLQSNTNVNKIGEEYETSDDSEYEIKNETETETEDESESDIKMIANESMHNLFHQSKKKKSTAMMIDPPSKPRMPFIPRAKTVKSLVISSAKPRKKALATNYKRKKENSRNKEILEILQPPKPKQIESENTAMEETTAEHLSSLMGSHFKIHNHSKQVKKKRKIMAKYDKKRNTIQLKQKTRIMGRTKSKSNKQRPQSTPNVIIVDDPHTSLIFSKKRKKKKNGNENNKHLNENQNNIRNIEHRNISSYNKYRIGWSSKENIENINKQRNSAIVNTMELLKDVTEILCIPQPNFDPRNFFIKSEY